MELEIGYPQKRGYETRDCNNEENKVKPKFSAIKILIERSFRKSKELLDMIPCHYGQCLLY